MNNIITAAELIELIENTLTAAQALDDRICDNMCSDCPDEPIQFKNERTHCMAYLENKSFSVINALETMLKCVKYEAI